MFSIEGEHDIRKYADAIRAESLKMVHRANASHIGGALSMADLLAVLYKEVLRVNSEEPDWEKRDRFILSKGHSCVGIYAALALRGFFSLEELEDYGKDGSRMMTHVSHKVPGVEFSTGSLGHGLPFGCGKALAAKRLGQEWRVLVMLSDRERDEGALSSVPWEPGKPSCLIAHTVKGKGVDFMENELLWHYRAPNEEQLRSALRQVGVSADTK